MKKSIRPAGENVIKRCKESKNFNLICERLHIDKIAHYYYQKWYKAESDTAKKEITEEYHRQIILALLLPFGISMGSAVAISFLADHVIMTLFVVTIALSYFINK